MTAQPHDPAFESLLEFLKASRSFDFTGYKRSTLMRRVQKRMQALELDTFEAFRDHLEVHPDEYEALFNTILINVTSFFRDAEAWRVLAEEFVPALLERKDPGDPIRVWSAGCATGQETYTLVMVLTEALGPEAFRERVKVYSTDWDDDALAQARQAGYPGVFVPVVAENGSRHFVMVGDVTTTTTQAKKKKDRVTTTSISVRDANGTGTRQMDLWAFYSSVATT